MKHSPHPDGQLAQLQALIGIVGNVFEAHTAALFLKAPKGAEGQDAYRLTASFSLSDAVAKDLVITSGASLVGWIIRSAKPLLITNFDQKKGVLGYYANSQETEIRAFMGCPLEDGLGALCLDSKRTYSFSERDQKILAQFAGLIHSLARGGRKYAQALHKSRHYHCLLALSGLREKYSRWEAFLEHYLALLSRGTGLGFCALAVRGEDGESYTLEGAHPQTTGLLGRSHPLGSGLAGWVFQHNTILVRTATDAGELTLFGPGAVNAPAVKSAACLPLTFNRKVRAVLVAASPEGQPIGEELRAFLRVAAGDLSLFLETLYLKNRLTPAHP